LGELEKDELKMLKADGGVKVLEVGPGKMREAGVQNGFVITHIDKINVHTVNEFNSLMKKSYNKGFVIEGVYPNGEAAFYVIKF
jgi:serine protease Do